MKKLILDSCYNCPHYRDNLPYNPYCDESGGNIPAIVKQTGSGAFTTELIKFFPDWCPLPDESKEKAKRSCQFKKNLNEVRDE